VTHMLRLAFAAAAACLIACACAQPDVGPKSGANPWTPEDWEVAHCGKRFRIATHEAPPFTIVDKTRCAVGSQLCPAAAWWEQGGGLTYKFVEQHLKPILIQTCKDKKMANVDVAFYWYLASDDTAGASNPVRMVCNGDFINHRKPSNSNCTANYEYKGPSPFGACKSRDDPTCVSKGPDLVAGAVHILRERVDLLDFTGPYVTVLFLLIGTIQALVGGLPSGRTGRVLAAIMTCKVQPEPDDGGEEEEAEEEAEEQNAESKKSSRVTSRAPSEAGDLPGPSIRVAKLCGRTQRMEEYLERLRLTVPR